MPNQLIENIKNHPQNVLQEIIDISSAFWERERPQPTAEEYSNMTLEEYEKYLDDVNNRFVDIVVKKVAEGNYFSTDPDIIKKYLEYKNIIYNWNVNPVDQKISQAATLFQVALQEELDRVVLEKLNEEVSSNSNLFVFRDGESNRIKVEERLKILNNPPTPPKLGDYATQNEYRNKEKEYKAQKTEYENNKSDQIEWLVNYVNNQSLKIYEFEEDKKGPQKGSLVVCAGTVTTKKAEEMGHGFKLFHKLFSETKYGVNGWIDKLQDKLDGFFNRNRKEEMPAYITIAEQDNLIGGVATVPNKKSKKGLTHETFANDKEREKEYIKQYKSAVKEAVEEAIRLNRPLFIQPLGVGSYGWDPRQAAKLFAESIREADPDNKVKITIPIFDTDPGSNDQKFKNAFIANMSEKIIKFEEKIKKIYEDKEEALNISDWEWHKAFIEHTASKLPGAGQEIELTEEVVSPGVLKEFTKPYMKRQLFQNFIDQYGFRYDKNKAIPRPDLESEEMKNYGGLIKQVLFKPLNKAEEIIQFSFALSNQNKEYKKVFEEFKKQRTADLRKECVIATLNDIKKLIETEKWKLGRWVSSTKINVEGQPKPKEVPNHAYKIYKKIENAHLDTADYKSALKILEEVQEITRKATTDKPMFFEKYRQRDAKTQKAYEVIEEQSAKTLESFKEQLKDIKDQGEESMPFDNLSKNEKKGF